MSESSGKSLRERLGNVLVSLGTGYVEPDSDGVARISRTTIALYIGSVVVPMILCLMYVLVVRSPGYLSEADLTIQADPSLGSQSVDFGLFSGPSSALTDAQLIESYIESPTLMEILDHELKLREHYANPVHDWFSRLAGDASREKFLVFYGTRVEVLIDGESLIIHLTVEAYSREYAQKLAQSIVSHASTFLNGISQQIARGQMAFVESELEKSNQRLRAASEQLIALQKKNELLSPETEALTLSTIIATLQTDLANRRAALATMRSYLSDNAPEVVAQKNGIAALARQVETERRKQVAGNSPALTDLYLDYQAAQTAVRVATDSYQSGLRSLETARLEASRTAKHLVEVSAPGLPDDALVPRRIYTITTVFFLLHIAFFILTLIAGAIRDHRDA